MPILALLQLISIPKFEEPHSLQLDYPIRRSPTSHPPPHYAPLDDISPGRSQVHLTFHLLQADGAVDRTTQYEVDRLLKWSDLIGAIERTVGTMALSDKRMCFDTFRPFQPIRQQDSGQILLSDWLKGPK